MTKKAYKLISVRQLFLFLVLSLGFVPYSLSGTPQENILNLMLDLQHDSNPISLASYDNLTRSEKIEHRVYLEQALSVSDIMTNEMKDSILRQYDEKIGEKGVGGGKIIGGLSASELPTAVETLPANEMNYLNALASGNEEAASLRNIILEAKALNYLASGVSANESLIMANSYLALSTDSIAAGGGVSHGNIQDVMTTSLELAGVSISSALALSDKSINLVTNPGSSKIMVPLDLGDEISLKISIKKSLEIHGPSKTFGIDEQLNSSGGGIHGVGVGL